MSPAYIAPAVETIAEPQHSRQGLAGAGDAVHNNGQAKVPLEIPLEPPLRARRFSSKSDLPGKKFRSGSPQLHHFLRSSPVAEDVRRGSSIPIARPSLRRYSSADSSSLPGPKSGYEGAASTSGDGWIEGGSEDRWASTQLQEIRESKRARLSPTSALLQPRATSSSRRASHTGTSSGSNSTLRGSPREDQVDEGRPGSAEGPSEDVSGTTPADALKLLQGDLPPVVVRSPKHEDTVSWSNSTVVEGKPRSPSARSTSSDSSFSSSPHSVASSERTADTDVSLSEREIDGDETPIASVPVVVDSNGSLTTTTSLANNKRHSRGSVSDPDRYGTPEMPRGTAKLPHIPASDLTPRVPNQGHPKHLPRAEKLPMSGYELLASSISASATTGSASRSRMSSFLASSSASNKYASRRNSNVSLLSASATGTEEESSTTTTIKPIYRRFEALNHRLLLHLQDELSELEEQLHRLDTADTQTRRLQSSILPASRRAEYLAGGELQWHKTDILSKIGYKLGQYNHVLSSFTSTRDLPAPSIADVTDYRNYLATHQPISEVETRFLDPFDDLVTLTAPDEGSTHGSATSSVGDARPARHQAAEDYLHSLRINDEPIVTPIPGTMHGNSWLVRHNRLSYGSGSQSSSRGSATSGSPGFARPGSGPEPLSQQLPMAGSGAAGAPSASPRLPSSPLRGAHTAVVTSSSSAKNKRSVEKPMPNASASTPTHVLLHVAFSMAVAVLVPILTFSVVPGFVGRMTVVLLVGLSVLGSVAQSEGMRKGVDSSTDLVFSGAVYVAVMAVVAGIIG